MKLSNKSAKRIASLFNSIAVGEMMLGKVVKEFKADHMTLEAFRTERALWTGHIVTAAKALREEFGIAAIGADAYTPAA